MFASTARRLIIAEGFATAASIHTATGDPVAVAFDKANLLPIAQALRGNLPALRITIAGDNDADGDGQDKAREAAAAVGGAAVIPTNPHSHSSDVWLMLALVQLDHWMAAERG